ncbi:hypothetical protein EB796_010618 [Bugula neritina]|uniref:EGF-like domain-containing protein n=1 Tax=Bugula neritina TaxID=10212 RepID=A0A7J7JXE0_BUGNE|nr:hypothetical protein EB796_010618 [Bugula neritina]
MAQVSILVYFLCLVCIHVAASTTSADQDMLSSPGMANNTLLHSTANLTTAHTSSPLSTNTTDFLQTNKVDTTSNTTGSDVTPPSIVTASVGSSLSLTLNATSQGSVITTSTALPTNKSSQTVDSLNSTYTNLVTSVVGSNSSDIGTGSNITSSVVETTTLIHSSDIPSSSLPMSTTADTSVTDARNSTTTNSSVTDAGESTTTNSSVTDGGESTTTSSSVTDGGNSTTTNSSVTTTEESTATNSSVTTTEESTTTNSSITDRGESTTTSSSITDVGNSTTTNSTVTDTGESTITSSSVTVPDPCVPQPCENNGMCRANGTGYTCFCSSGWTGFNCSTDVDECAESLSSCNNQTSTCENNDGGYSCVCNKGYMKDTKTENCVDIDECALGMSDCDSGKGEVCSNTDGSFQCLCDEARDYVKKTINAFETSKKNMSLKFGMMLFTKQSMMIQILKNTKTL